MTDDQTLGTEVAGLLEEDDERDSSAAALEDEQSSQTAALDDKQFSQTAALDDKQLSQTAALDDERPSGRSDAKDPWHGLNDFDDE